MRSATRCAAARNASGSMSPRPDTCSGSSAMPSSGSVVPRKGSVAVTPPSVAFGPMKKFEVTVDGRTLRGYDRGPRDGTVVVWHHGTPNIGSPPEPLFDVSDRLGIRWVGYDRPGYGGSTRNVGRTIASAASDAAAVVDHLGIDRFAVLGHSGGGSHALACGALLRERVSAVVSISGVAPYRADGLDWFGGMSPSGVASLRAALEGREAKERYESSPSDGDPGFVPADHEALAGEWARFGAVVGPALA